MASYRLPNLPFVQVSSKLPCTHPSPYSSTVFLPAYVITVLSSIYLTPPYLQSAASVGRGRTGRRRRTRRRAPVPARPSAAPDPPRSPDGVTVSMIMKYGIEQVSCVSQCAPVTIPRQQFVTTKKPQLLIDKVPLGQ